MRWDLAFMLAPKRCCCSRLPGSKPCMDVAGSQNSNTAHLAQPDEQVKDVGIIVEQSACSTECTV